MLCVIRGMVMKAYERTSKDKEGHDCMVKCFDVYDSEDVVRISKIPDKVWNETKKMSIGEFPCKVYSNQYGVSLVYNAEEVSF